MIMIDMTVAEALEELTQANFHSEHAVLSKRIERLETCLEGCLHFDDGFIKFGALGDALNGWRNEARSLLGVE